MSSWWNERRRTRVFSELGALIWEAGNVGAVLRLEQLWRQLGRTRVFTLECAYHLHSFGSQAKTGAFLDICQQHQHVRPAESFLNLGTESERLRAVACLQQAAAAVGGVEEQKDLQRNYDPFTRLPTREILPVFLQQAFARSDSASLVAVIPIHLFDGKTIGNQAGDFEVDRLMLQSVQRVQDLLQRSLPGKHKLLRTGTDELTVIAEGLPNYQSIQRVVLGLQGAFSGPFEHGSRDWRISPSIGVSAAPPQATEPFEMQQNAWIALRHAKRKGKGQVEFYTARLGETARLREHFEARLRNAIDAGELTVYFQPEISVETSRPSRYEALLRWFPTADSVIPPTTFIPVAEESGLIVPIGKWVLEQACRRAAEWQSGPLAGVGVAVNISAIQLDDPELVETVAKVLKRARLKPELLELELTETLLVSDFERSRSTLEKLKALGVTLAIDDFGTGYSSLAYLQNLSIDALKIDRSFLADVVDRHSKAPILRGLIGIAHELGVRIVVEGVETAAQYDAVVDFGCDDAQGFLLGRPAPFSEIRG